MKTKDSHNHRKLAQYFSDKPEDQSDNGRHKCAGCAYIIGYYLGYNRKNLDLNKVIESLPISQAEPQRHHDPIRAINDGYNQGRTDLKKGSSPQFLLLDIQSYIPSGLYLNLQSQ